MNASGPSSLERLLVFLTTLATRPRREAEDWPRVLLRAAVQLLSSVEKDDAARDGPKTSDGRSRPRRTQHARQGLRAPPAELVRGLPAELDGRAASQREVPAQETPAAAEVPRPRWRREDADQKPNTPPATPEGGSSAETLPRGALAPTREPWDAGTPEAPFAATCAYGPVRSSRRGRYRHPGPDCLLPPRDQGACGPVAKSAVPALTFEVVRIRLLAL